MYLHYYVYAYLRTDGTPYYIGKGKGRRAWSKDHTVNLPLDKNNIIMIEQHLTNVGAMAIERKLIQWYGRKDNNTGILRNRTDGGEGASGYKLPVELRKNISDRQKGNTYGTGNKGKGSERSFTNKAQWRLNISLAKTGISKPVTQCPHCNKIGGFPQMKQWHFDRCKRLNTIIKE